MRPITIVVLALALLLPGVASALPWWVEDDADAERLNALLEALWPGHPVEVVIGEPDFGREGVSSDGQTLTLVNGERVRFAPTDGDLATQVALVRSWLRESAVQEGGWLPETEERPGPYAVALFGGGARLPTAVATSTGDFALGPAAPSGSLGIGGGFAWKHVRVGAMMRYRFAERAGVGSQAIALQRLFAGATISLGGAMGPIEQRFALGLGARVAFLRTDDQEKPVIRALPGLFTAVQWWGPIDDLVDFGGGLGLSFDTASLAVRVGDEDQIPLLLSPVTVFGELGLRIGCPCRARDGR